MNPRRYIHVLRALDPAHPTGFIHVYPTDHQQYRAKLFHRHLGNFSTPEAAAEAVVREYDAIYGPWWALAYRASQAGLKPIRVDPAEGISGYTADVYVFGDPHPVREAGRVAVYPSAAEARKAARRWLSDRCGLFAAFAAFRGRHVPGDPLPPRHSDRTRGGKRSTRKTPRERPCLPFPVSADTGTTVLIGAA